MSVFILPLSDGSTARVVTVADGTPDPDCYSVMLDALGVAGLAAQLDAAGTPLTLAHGQDGQVVVVGMSDGEGHVWPLGAVAPENTDGVSLWDLGTVGLEWQEEEAPAGARSAGDGYTHHAGEPVTDAPGSVIDIDGETFVVGAATREHPGTDRFDDYLAGFDYTLVTPAGARSEEIEAEAAPAGARWTAEDMAASLEGVEVLAETTEHDAGSGAEAQYVTVRRLADGRVTVTVGSAGNDTEVWAALDPHSWETIRSL